MQKLFCDIDGTIAYHHPRIKKWTAPSWPGTHILPQAFHREEILLDPVMPDALAALNSFKDFFEIIYLTARHFPNAQAISKEWLDMHSFPSGEVIAVGTALHKIPILKDYPNCLFIDDMRGLHEYEQQNIRMDIVRAICKLPIKFEIFDNNWDYLVKKYCK